MGRSSTICDGLVVGLIAYASVALFNSVFDFLAARGTLYTVPWWSIVVGNGLAALLAGLYLIWSRPGLRQRFNPLALIEG